MLTGLHMTRLAKVLFEKCVSQQELARGAQISPAMISYVVRGVRRPGPKLRRRIARALRQRPETLFPAGDEK